MGGYFDNNATTPLDPRVREAMLSWMGETFGNPSSAHGYGRVARNAVEEAREEVAALLDVEAPEIVFTASGTEGNNTVIEALGRRAGYGGRLVLSAFEHPSIDKAAARAETSGIEVMRVRPNHQGVVQPEAMLDALTEDTRLATLMLVNNEVGTIQPVAEVASVCRERGIPVLCDAVQAVGKMEVRPRQLGVDYLTLGAHKFHGPAGAAALWVRGEAAFEPLLVGGTQERQRRASTVNVAAVVGLGEAARCAREESAERRERIAGLQERLEASLSEVPDTVVHGAEAPRLPTTTHVSFLGLSGQDLMIRLDLAGFAVSTGSACGSGKMEPSPAMAAMGVPEAEVEGALRISLGCENTAAEVDGLVEALRREVQRLRNPREASVQAHR